jgi:hypothetical protein
MLSGGLGPSYFNVSAFAMNGTNTRHTQGNREAILLIVTPPKD